PGHVVVPTVFYWALRQWLKTEAPSHGLEVSFVDQADSEVISAAIRPGETKLIWLETPANPTWAVADIERVGELAHEAGALLAVDSTCATPVFSQPLSLGADIVMHSATKYLNGHSDVLAGVLAFAEDGDAAVRAAAIRKSHGGILGGRDAAELLRGLRTLHLRVRRQSDTALKIALQFADHPAVSQVLYPGLPWHPGHPIARRQMSGGFGGMLSLRLSGGADAAAALVRETRLWKTATSLGGVESLIEHRAPVEGPDTLCPDDLVRLSTGIESPDDLIADLDQALAAISHDVDAETAA
ncbi:MAG: PLP-dependent transferase, partial [Pseudomonadota bacterium]